MARESDCLGDQNLYFLISFPVFQFQPICLSLSMYLYICLYSCITFLPRASFSCLCILLSVYLPHSMPLFLPHYLSFPIQSLLFSVCFHLTLSLPISVSIYIYLFQFSDVYTSLPVSISLTPHLSLSSNKDKEEEEEMKVEGKKGKEGRGKGEGDKE